MKASWTTGLPEDEAERIVSSYKAGAELRERLAEILSNKMEDQLRYGRRKENYNSPSWALEQADTCGFNRALEYVLSLIESKDTHA
jgi:hypothetical protein